ncbi:MAG: hypothetical protein UU22_C0002G0026 [Parcubacteria group bacterium GW2011_GWA2_40_8]|uniref:Uncharacterized protein n=1 Tax=Candidatus Terrybacteria bacterium RIFCSPLOWO2_01_FULL_40_23 TaxID=1802366 RepID=A0A1G2PUD3_9BACT|nr:MAG: hypothetical protein UT82_C0001G0035 [Parcubacteria group bacterium GW2011_GWB1_40_14]KKR79199.1 MAG: hypothetical protein UU22_C0002G0026 [Parcubacteria group bacterium GW2011_GWA2_40_8]OHA51935.1 MAG: hypothetical protein A3A97_01925 [Candidatus Terrybacteria bacterium RIFCSPLOWO2_01_FULL_40_23]
MSLMGKIIGSRKGIFILLFILIILLAAIFFWQTIITIRVKTYYKEVELNNKKQEYMQRLEKIIKTEQEQKLNIVSGN